MPHKSYRLIGKCNIDKSVNICSGSIIGKQFRPLLEGEPILVNSQTVIGKESYVGYNSIIGAGTIISDGVIVDDACIIENDVVIKNNTLVIYRSQICSEAIIGLDCVIGGFIAERVKIGDSSRVFGKIVHSHRKTKLGWDNPDAEEPSAIIHDNVFIGFDAKIIGGIKIERGAYICAGAIVTKNVPQDHVAFGTNKIMHLNKWKGQPLIIE